MLLQLKRPLLLSLASPAVTSGYSNVDLARLSFIYFPSFLPPFLPSFLPSFQLFDLSSSSLLFLALHSAHASWLLMLLMLLLMLLFLHSSASSA